MTKRTPEPAEVLIAAAERLARNQVVALCTLARCEGSTPGKPGWRLLVSLEGEPIGNLGGGAFEAMAAHDARQLLEARRTASEVRRYYLTEEATRGEATGMVCGGFVEVLIEVLGIRPTLVIFGAGPVGQAIAAVATLAGFDLVVADDRDELLVPSLFPTTTRLMPPTAAASLVADLPEVAVAVVTRCWETDLEALRLVAAASHTPPGYLGLMGSRRKIAKIRELLEAEGVDLLALGLRAPIGLPIGGDSPGEIAVAVVAEAIAARHGRREGD